MYKSDSEKIIQKYSKRPIDLKTAKRIIYQYNRNQLHLAKVEFEDSNTNKKMNKTEINNIHKVDKNCSSDKLDIYNNPYYYEEVIIQTTPDDWNKVSKIVHNISLHYNKLNSDNQIKNKVNKEENKNEKINENVNNNNIINIENKKENINNGKIERYKFDESKNKIKFEEIKINIPGKSNIKYNNNYENSKLKYDKLKEDFQINKLEILSENKIKNRNQSFKNKKENLNEENNQINNLNDKDDNIPTSIDSQNQDSKSQIIKEKLDEKNILNEIKNISEIIGKVNIQISNCEKMGNKKETINLNNNKFSSNNKEKNLMNDDKNRPIQNIIKRNSFEVNKEEYKQYKNNNCIYKNNEIININNKKENNDNNKKNVINENLIKNVFNKESNLNNFKESENKIIEDKNKILFEKYNKDNFSENDNNVKLIYNQEKSIPNNKLISDNFLDKKEQNNFLNFDNIKDGKTITFRKEDIKNQFDNEKKENKILTYEDIKKLYGIDDIKRENNQLNIKQKSIDDYNNLKIKYKEEIEKNYNNNNNDNINKEEIKVNMKDLNNYLLNHMKIEESINFKKKKEEYDFFNESNKISIIKNPNNIGIEIIKINHKIPINKIKKNIEKKNSNKINKKIINNEENKKIENKSKENIHNINLFELSDIEKHKQNQTTLDEIRNLLINNNKSFQNIFIKDEQINKNIEDKLHNKNSFENSAIFKVNKIILKKKNNNSNSEDYNITNLNNMKYKINKSIQELNNSIPKNLEDLTLYKPIKINDSLMSYNPKTGKKQIPKYKELESKANKLMYEKYLKNNKYSPINLIYSRGKSVNKYRTDRINYSINYKGFIYPCNNLHDSFIKIHSKG